MGAQSSDPWKVMGADFPVEGPVRARLEFLVRYAVLAPSTHNTQPWLFRVRGDALELFADRSRALPVCDPHDRELTISCGAALQIARLAARNLGWEGWLELMPNPRNPDLLARLKLGRPWSPTAAEERRFRAIPERHTSRTPYAAEGISPLLLENLAPLASSYGATLTLRSDAIVRERAAELVSEADRKMMADPAVRSELAKWMSPRTSSTGEGMSISSFGISDRLTRAAAGALKAFDIGAATAATHELLVTETPWLGLLSTADDDERSWLRAGMAFADIVLELTASGISSSYLEQPIEVPELRPRVAEIMGAEGLPQMLMRIGRGKKVPAAARRPAGQVIGT